MQLRETIVQLNVLMNVKKTNNTFKIDNRISISMHFIQLVIRYNNMDDY